MPKRNVPVDFLKRKLKELRYNASVMYEVFEMFQECIEPDCTEKGRKWDKTECRMVTEYITDPFSIMQMAGCCYQIKRTPYSIWNCFIWEMWNDAENGKVVKLRRAIKAGRRRGYIDSLTAETCLKHIA